MKILDRYLGRRMAAAFLKTAVALVLIIIAADLVTHRSDNIIEFEIPWLVVAQYYLAMIPQILGQYQVAALSILIAGLMVLGGAAHDNEVVAALAGGIGLRRVMMMPAAVALMIALASLLMTETFGPVANRRAYAIESQFFANTKDNTREGVSWAHLSGDWTCHIGAFNRLALTGTDVLMDRITPDELVRIHAERIYWEPERGQWLIENGRRETFLRAQRLQRVERITQEPAPIQESPDDLFAIEQPVQTRTGAEHAAVIRAAEARNMPVESQWVYFHARYAQAALPFVMIWLAAPFALRLRRGGIAVGFGVSIAIALSYIIVFWVFMGLGVVGKLPPVWAAWSANLLFLATGLTLFKLTPT